MVANIRSGSSPGGALYYNKEKVDKDEAEVLLWQKMLEPYDKCGRLDIDACMESFMPYLEAPQDYEHGFPCLAEPFTGGQADRRTAPENRL